MHGSCIVISSRFQNGRRAITRAIARIFQKVLRKPVDKPPSGVFFSLHDAAQHLLADVPDHGLRAGIAARPRRCCSRPRTRPYYRPTRRSEEHTSELQSLMRISYAVFCLKKKNTRSYTLSIADHQVPEA